MQSAIERENQQSLARLHTYGIYARTTNAMLHITDIGEFKDIVMEFMTELNLTGYIRFFDNSPSKTAIRFGQKPEHFIYQNALTLQHFMSSQRKLMVSRHCVFFSSGPVFAFCGFDAGNQKASAQDIEPLQDILTLFFDALAIWLEQWALKQSLTQRLHQTLDDTIDANEQLIDKYLSTSEELTTELTQYFRELNLDSTQESFILKALHQSSLKQAQLMEQEIKRNTALGDALIEAVGELTRARNDIPPAGISSVELF